MGVRKETCRRMVIIGSIVIIFALAAIIYLALGGSSETPYAGYGIGAIAAVGLYILFKLLGRVCKEGSCKPESPSQE